MPAPYLLFLLALVPQQRRGLIDSGSVRSVELESGPGTWAQYFRLDDSVARPEDAPQGLLRYVAWPDRQGGVHVDLEVQFLADGLRVVHTEEASLEHRRLVFRELREGAGRTVLLDGTPATGFEGHELGIGEAIRLRPGTGEFPLLLIESARLGDELPAELSVFDPLAAAFEPLKTKSWWQDGEHVVEARRTDGGLRWRIRFRGEELLEWRFQDRGPVARSIPREVFQALLDRHENGVRKAREAAASTRPSRR